MLPNLYIANNFFCLLEFFLVSCPNDSSSFLAHQKCIYLTFHWEVFFLYPWHWIVSVNTSVYMVNQGYMPKYFTHSFVLLLLFIGPTNKPINFNTEVQANKPTVKAAGKYYHLGTDMCTSFLMNNHLSYFS